MSSSHYNYDVQYGTSLEPDHSLARDRHVPGRGCVTFLGSDVKIYISSQICKNATKLSHDSNSQRRLELDLVVFKTMPA